MKLVNKPNIDTENSKRKRTLIVSLPPEIIGGVGAMTRILADFFRDQGHDVTIAYYATRRHRRELIGRPFFKKSQSRTETNFSSHHCVAVGCNFPELEFSYTQHSSLWQDLIDSHDFHIAAGGTVAVAAPLAKACVPHLIWCASDVYGDRSARQASMSLVRRVFDKSVVTPGLKRQEQQVLLGQGRVLAISPFTRDCLSALIPAERNKLCLLPIPTDMKYFTPPVKPASAITLGFAGRLTDPRKNASLLFQVIALVRKNGVDANLKITGETSPELNAEIKRQGLNKFVSFSGILNREGLRDFYQGLTVFIIPSYQEGLSIVGIEAMASGVPVVSTRCGGPESFVRDGKNGYLTDFDAKKMAARVLDICTNSELRQKFSKTARSSVEEKYGFENFKETMKQEWQGVWQEDL